MYILLNLYYIKFKTKPSTEDKQSLKPQPLDSVCLLNCYRTSSPSLIIPLHYLKFQCSREVYQPSSTKISKNILKDYLISMIMTTGSYKYPNFRLKIFHVSININVFLKVTYHQVILTFYQL